MAFDVDDIPLSKVTVLEDRLPSKLGEATGDVHVLLWPLEGRAAEVGNKRLTNVGRRVGLVDESETN